ncbi:transposable element Tc1 transposase [Trichonephila clavipes]|nr:transposable element Tc1 transposase [Trichonephila clavipes]
MCDLSDVKRGMVIGARLAGASVSRTANLVGISRTTVPRVMTAYTNLGKVSSAKHNTGRKLKLKDPDRRVLRRILAQNHGRVAIPKPLVSGQNAAKRLQWCLYQLNWTQMQWEQVIWSDESAFTLFQTTGRVFVW